MTSSRDPYAYRPAVSLSNTQNASFDMATLSGDIEVKPVGLTAADGAASRGLLYKRKGVKAKIGVHLMHPRTDHSQNYTIPPLVEAGYTVLGRNGRWPLNDVATVHEALLLDIAAGIRRLHDEGCEQVVLLGNSGGSSLSAFYQAQARAAPGDRLTYSPGGDPVMLGEQDLPAAAGIVFVGGHAGQGVVLSRCIDPAVVDEDVPLLSDPALDLYNPANGFVSCPAPSTYDRAFLDSYRQAQVGRLRRLDARALDLLEAGREAERLKDRGKGGEAQRLARAAKLGWHMVIYRTTADPCFIDPSIDPDDRRVFSYFSARPDLENYGETGFARVVTPRAWLSTWSGLSSNANTIRNVAGFDDPFLIVHYAGDCGTRMADVRAMMASSPSTDKTLTLVRNADHYGFAFRGDGGVGQRSKEGLEAVLAWMLTRFAPTG